MEIYVRTTNDKDVFSLKDIDHFHFYSVAPDVVSKQQIRKKKSSPHSENNEMVAQMGAFGVCFHLRGTPEEQTHALLNAKTLLLAMSCDEARTLQTEVDNRKVLQTAIMLALEAAIKEGNSAGACITPFDLAERAVDFYRRGLGKIVSQHTPREIKAKYLS